MRVEKGRPAAKAILVLGLATLLLGACAYGTPYGGYSGYDYGHRYGGGYYSGRAPYGYTHRSAYGHGYRGGYRYGYRH